MSAVLKGENSLAPMRDSDLDEVLAIETAVYSHPWTRANFVDSLRADYICRSWRIAGQLAGYFVLAVAAGEAHLLNLSVAAARQRRGYGSALLQEAIARARARQAKHVFLEVRPSNRPAIALYRQAGFRELSVRRGYYPAQAGREDALILSLAL